MRKISLLTLLSAALLLIPSFAAAQNATTTGQIRGRVTTAQGEPLGGVYVIGRNLQTGLERNTLTDEDGGYALRLLPPGTYRVRAEFIGYAADSVAGLQVGVGQTATANITMAQRAVAIEGIEVAASRRPPIDVTGAAVVQTVTQAEIAELPVLGRDFTDFINLSGVVAPDPGETTGGQFSIAGQRASQTNLQIDGVDANNAFFGENRGGSRIPFVFSLESIQEFQVITNGYDVEYGNYSGGIVNVVTRGGTNDFSGSAYLNYRGNALTGRGFLDTLAVGDYEVTQFAARASGPIITDRAFFLLSVDGQRRREPQIPLLRSRFGPGGERENAAAFEEVGRFWEILEDTYGISGAESGFQPFQTTNDVISAFGRLDFNLSPQHRLSARHNFATYSNDNEWDENFDFLYGASRAEEIQSTSHSFVTELQSVFSPSTFNVLRFQFSNEDRPRQGKNLRPALIARLSNGDQIGYGGTFVGFNNDLDERKIQLIDNFTHVVGSHTLKVGTNAIFTHIRNQFLPGVNAPCGVGRQGAGVFCFGSVDDLEAGTPSSYIFNVRQGGGIPLSEFDVSEWSLYIQDEWQASPKLTITAGLRHDRQHFDDAPGRVIDVERGFGFPTGAAPTDNDNISPRLSVAYDVRGDGQSVVRAGVGYFFGRVPYVLAGNVLGSQRPLLNLVCTGSVDDDDPDAPPSPLQFRDWSTGGTDNPTTCRGAAGFSGVPTYTLWNQDFEYPETFKGNLGYETLLGDRTRLAVDLIYSRSTNLYTVRNLNLRPAQFQLDNEGGRRVYSPAGVFNPGSANTLASRIYTDFGDVYVNYNDGLAEAWVATAEANHRFSDVTSIRGSYTFTRSHDNSSYSCCEAGGGFANPNVGLFSPNEIGGFGDEDGSWGASDFTRDHTFIFSGFTELPLGIELGAIWRLQSGRPYTPEVSGDINGDGVSFNDRPFIFAPEDLPIAETGEEGDAIRDAYGALLAENDCIGDYVGEIIPRNTCRTPWTNQLDMRLSKSFATISDQRAEIQLDVFNVLNGIGQLNCDSGELAESLRDGERDLPGWCGWGRFTTVSGSSRNLYFSPTFQNGSIRYSPSNSFGRESVVGSNLLLQFQAQIALRYYF